MPLIKWSDKLSVSMPDIDRQHQKLVDMMNRLNDAMLQGKGNDVLGAILKEMIAYAHTHFAYEERLMQQASFPGLADHRTIHQLFLAKAQDLKTDFESGKIGMSAKTMNFLSQWLTDHIMGEDKKYAAVLAPTKASV